jgi:Lon protease-like protein
LTESAARLPIFPLGTVLFPGGVLPLRIFEARYMDMIRRAMRDGSEFGIVSIRKGTEVGDRDVDTEEIGCRARIDDWNMEELGVLEITTTGTERFAIVARQVEADGLMVAKVRPLEREPLVALPADMAPCLTLLKRIVQRLDEAREQSDDAEAAHPAIAKPYLFDDATWVGNRLSEILPVPRAAKQKLMALTDAPTRLAIILQYLKQHGIT